MTMNDCVPCAKCGGMHLVRKDNGIGQPYIRCTGCINFSLPSPTFDMAVAEWNRMNGHILKDKMKGSEKMTEEKTLIYLPVEQLHPHPNNPRKDLGDLTELTESIRANGVLQNLTVVPGHKMSKSEYIAVAKKEGVSKIDAEGTYDPDTVSPEGYTVIIGHRRLAAAKLAGLSTVPCVVMKMDALEQIRTMAIENMHRTDLTPIEQADSFQLMLDLGDTVQTIADNTGFSETTVRRRLNLLDYDRTKLEAANERGGTLQDYMELQKVKDPERRDKVLDAIGTKNFKNELESAINAEQREENRAYYLEAVKKFAKKFPKKESTYNGKWDQVVCYRTLGERTAVEPPKDADKVEYFYTDDTWGVTIYKHKVKEKVQRDKKSPEQIAWDHWYKETTETLTETAKRHRKLRVDFVKGMSEGSLEKKAQMAWIVSVAGHITSGYSAVEPEKYWIDEFVKDVYGFEKKAYDVKNGTDKGSGLLEEYYEKLDKEPVKLLLVVTVAALEGHRDYIPFWKKDYSATPDNYTDAEERDIAALRTEYLLLEKLGYEVSDEEKKTYNGEYLAELKANAPEKP